jgi:sialic acid synthase SpsE/mannose-6-phosphate isomerase-like protein (cupin superfamily)
MNEFDFRNLFVFDMANNHQGDIEHGLNIIRQMGAVARKHGVRGVMKFQFRQLDTFIHPAHRKESKAKHIDRFLSTELKREQYQVMLDEIRKEGLLAMCTPFDEESVDVITAMGFDFLKIASCSAKDWPLLEKAAQAGMRVVVSTGGMEIGDIDDIVSFFEHRGVPMAIMYCVSIYPIPDDEFHLNQIDILRRRYPKHTIGWSTHEHPDNVLPGQIAVAKGAQIFERHVGIANDKVKLNAYSSTPEQVDRWIGAVLYAQKLCGGTEPRAIPLAEKESIDSLRRGVYLKKSIKPGSTLQRDDVYFAMPFTEGQLESGRWKEGIVLNAELGKDAPLLLEAISVPPASPISVLKGAVHEVKALLNEAAVVLNSDFQIEFSHHYGIENFREVGALIINCINREYCKKIIVQLPGQSHPVHYHKRKEETFQILWGVLESEVDGHRRTLHPGETALIQPGVWHRFWSETGCVFEEVSTTHYNNDSVYNDRRINDMPREQRKTAAEHWGRFIMAVGS